MAYYIYFYGAYSSLFFTHNKDHTGPLLLQRPSLRPAPAKTLMEYELRQDLTVGETPAEPREEINYRPAVFTMSEMPMWTYAPLATQSRQTGEWTFKAGKTEVAVENADGVVTPLSHLDNYRPDTAGYSQPMLTRDHCVKKFGCKAAPFYHAQKNYYDQKLLRKNRSGFLGPERVEFAGRGVIPPHILYQHPFKIPSLSKCYDYNGTRPHLAKYCKHQREREEKLRKKMKKQNKHLARKQKNNKPIIID